MLNAIWFGMMVIAILTAAWQGKLEALTQASVDSAKDAVTLAISLIGVMGFWLGLMKIVEDGGLLKMLARAIRPVMTRLFPDVPADHPAMGSMIMNISANMLGLGNAATPFGLKAMKELDRLNPKRGTATDSMCLFLAINTSNVSLFPLGVIALRATLGSKDPASIFATTHVATACGMIVAIITAKVLSRTRHYRRQWETAPDTAPAEKAAEEAIEIKEVILQPVSLFQRWLCRAIGAAFFGLLIAHTIVVARSEGGLAAFKMVMSQWLLAGLMLSLILFGMARGVKIYESLIEGAKEGFQVAVRIIPFLVAILVAVAMFRASGAMDFLIGVMNPLTSRIGLPSEALPMALLRPLSGSGAYGLMTEIMKVHGPDSFIGYLVSTLQGSTETTFYVLAVYFGVAQVKVIRHTLPACLVADVVATLAAVWVCHLFYA